MKLIAAPLLLILAGCAGSYAYTGPIHPLYGGAAAAIPDEDLYFHTRIGQEGVFNLPLLKCNLELGHISSLTNGQPFNNNPETDLTYAHIPCKIWDKR